jgi:hypothetical protein
MNRLLDGAMFCGYMALFTAATATLIIWRSRSARQDELRFGPLRGRRKEPMFSASPLGGDFGPARPARAEPFAITRPLRTPVADWSARSALPSIAKDLEELTAGTRRPNRFRPVPLERLEI